MQQLELFPFSAEELEQVVGNLSTKQWFQIRENDKDLYELLKPIRERFQKREYFLRREQERKQRQIERDLYLEILKNDRDLYELLKLIFKKFNKRKYLSLLNI